MPERRGREFVDFLVGKPEFTARLLADHFPDANGRCAGCAQDDRLREHWPCGLQGLAKQAQGRILAEQQPRWITP